MSKKRLTIILISVIAVLLVIATVFALLKSRETVVPDGTLGNTTGNLNNGGLFCESDGVLYYANPYDANTLYSLDLESGKSKKLADISAEYINVGGKYIFFYGKPNTSSQGLGSVVANQGIYRIDKSGSNLKAISKDSVRGMVLIGNEIFYQHFIENKGITLAVLELSNNKSTELLNSAINPFGYYQDYIYYNGVDNNHYLYRYDVKNRTEQQVLVTNVWYPVYDGQYVYYLDIDNDYRLCRYSFNTNSIDVLTNERIDTFNVYNDVIFYQVSSSTAPCMMRMNADGSNQMIVADGVYTSIYITSEYVYFKPYNSDFSIYKTPTYGLPSVSEFTESRTAALNNFK